jgi:hypothetical protein
VIVVVAATAADVAACVLHWNMHRVTWESTSVRSSVATDLALIAAFAGWLVAVLAAVVTHYTCIDSMCIHGSDSIAHVIISDFVAQASISGGAGEWW